MKSAITRILVASAAVGALFAAQPVLADGEVVCGAGPQANWQPVRKLRKAAWLEKWEILEIQIQGDCYEVYARTEQGQAVEAFFHPETLKKLVVFRRGQEIFRRRGFEG